MLKRAQPRFTAYDKSSQVRLHNGGFEHENRIFYQTEPGTYRER